jgi:O-antigen biosynthesis protein WbqV
LQAWLLTLQKAVNGEQRNVIVAVLKDAVPEFKAGAA